MESTDTPADAKRPRDWTVRPAAVALAYGLGGVLCLALFDAVATAVPAPYQRAADGVAGLAFVAVSAGLFWQVMRHHRAAAEREAAARQATEAVYRLIAENANDVIWTGDLDGRITYVSPSVLRLRGYTPEEVLARPGSAGVCPGSLPLVEKGMAHLAAQIRGEGPDAPITAEVEQPCKDGSTVWTEVIVRAMRDPQGRAAGLLGVSRDITARRKAEQDLRQGEVRLRTLFEEVPIGIVIVDSASRVLEANPAFQRITGYSLAELRQLPSVLSMVHPAEQAASVAHYIPVVEGDIDRVPPSEWRLVRKDGTEITIRHMGAAVRDAEGRFLYAMALIEDITRLRQTEERLRHVHKMEAVGLLAGGVAHDFNNLLQVILGCTAEVLEAIEPNDPLATPLRQTDHAARHAASLTKQLLAFGRQQVLQPELLDINELVADQTRMLCRLLGERIRLEFHPGKGVGSVLADRAQLQQVLLNLCVNARDAMPGGGQVTLTTEDVCLDERYCQEHTGARPGRHVAIRVTDTGIGMDDRVRERIFEPFFTTKELGKGTGLGLSVVFGVVSQHGGTVTAASAPGHGSTFTVLQPCAVAAPTPPVSSPVLAGAPGGQETILLAEDEPLVRDMSRRILQRVGYHVLCADDGAEAVRLAAANPGDVDLLLLDVVMPGLGGREAYATIAAEQGPIPCLLMSGYADVMMDAPPLPPGVGFLQKPYETPELLRAVRLALDAGPERPAAGGPGEPGRP